MTAYVEDAQIERFAALVARRLGLDFDGSKFRLLAEVLERRARVNGRGRDAYLSLFEDPLFAAQEMRALARELTVTESYFFRHVEQLEMLVDLVLARARARSVPPAIRLLSVGCAGGEEPYSIAMLLRERLGDAEADVRVRAIDVNTAALERARLARYTHWALRETSVERARRWFVNESRGFVVNEVVRSTVAFREHNLVDRDPELFAPSSYDAVLFRNVLMYLTRGAAERCLELVARALVPRGLLLLGYAENLRDLSSHFELHRTGDVFYYERREEPLGLDGGVGVAGGRRGVPAGATSCWVEAIDRSYTRVRALTVHEAGVTPRARAEEPEPEAGVLDRATEMLRSERFVEALAILDRSHHVASRSRPVRLLRGVLLLNTGGLDDAEALCGELLGDDERDAAAHYLLALVSEAREARDVAQKHGRLAVHFDPTFAMPRLHLGLMARKRGEMAVARRELERALVLLGQEDATRLLLFGGGFDRAALVALCRAEIQACGAVS